MKVNLVKIGNSQGIRIPKTLIEQCGFDGEIELEVKEGALLLRPAKPSREGWDEGFEKADQSREAEPLLTDSLSEEWDNAEWSW
jgi:antitoxin MazE